MSKDILWIGPSVEVVKEKQRIRGDRVKQCLIQVGTWNTISWISTELIKNNTSILKVWNLVLIKCKDCGGLHETTSLSCGG
jgi:hypothetical protein